MEWEAEIKGPLGQSDKQVGKSDTSADPSPKRVNPTTL